MNLLLKNINKLKAQRERVNIKEKRMSSAKNNNNANKSNIILKKMKNLRFLKQSQKRIKELSSNKNKSEYDI